MAGAIQVGGDDERPWAAALAGLPGMGPRRLGVLLGRAHAAAAWAAVCAGTAVDDELVAAARVRQPDRLRQRWREAARAVDVAALSGRLAELGVQVAIAGRPGYWPLLADDLEPPVVLFTSGPLEAVAERPRVAIVGTRGATAYGLGVAHRLGRELAAEGVSIVSGLALGIDGASHRGALAGPRCDAVPVAVVGSGHDVAYPRRHAALWRDVAARGVLVSEAPPGVRPEAWRFPARNRVIAALAHVVVVVESGATGGSLTTVEEALLRDRSVMAVPGPILTATSVGTNTLLAEGASVVRDVEDVLVELGMGRGEGGARRGSPEVAPDPGDAGARGGIAAVVLGALVGGPVALAALADQLELPLPELVLAIDALVDEGRVARRGQWVERTGAAPRPRRP